jgi:uncharacterized integral membrane protein
MKLIKRILTVIILLILFVVVYQNYDVLQHSFTFRFNLHFIGWYTSKIPVWLIIVISFICGYAIAYISGLLQKLSYKKKIKQMELELQSTNTPPSGIQQK